MRSLIVALALFSSTAFAADDTLVCDEQMEMGTPFKICVYAAKTDEMGVRFDLAKAYRELKEINGWMSDWVKGTELNQINEAAGARPVKVRKELFDLLVYVRDISDLTKGAFDPTFNAFWGLYNFKAGAQREPSLEEINERLPLVNYKNVELDANNQTVFLKKPGMKLGLGGIGQGYGVDKIVKKLKTRYKSGYVDGSGDTYFWGKKPNGELWTTAVRNPLDKTKDVIRIYGTDFAITTAGDDEKFFMVGDRRVHHILDPKTGRPANLVRQVTVIAPTATEADALDTASFVLGTKEGKSIIEKKNLAAVFITDKEVTVTKGLQKEKTQWGEVYRFTQSTVK